MTAGAHFHWWQPLANARGTWFWRCGCGAYLNADGRQTAPTEGTQRTEETS